MLKDSKELRNASQERLALLDDFCKRYSLIGLVQADHLGLKCEDNESFLKQRELFEYCSAFIYQSIISKRRVAIIGLREPIGTAVGEIRFLELSDQKEDGSQKDMFDHVEIVPTSISYEKLVEHLQKEGVTLKEIVRPHHTTHDMVLPEGFIIRLSRELLINKIKRDEMI